MTDHLTGVIDTVYTTPLGSVLAQAATTGDGSVFVDDTADFDEEIGGTLGLGTTTYLYTTVDPETGEITVPATLAADADEGDRVDLWDIGSNEAAVETRALVLPPGAEVAGDSIDATVAQSQALTLAEGQREPGTGESVRMELQGLDWVVTDVRGKKPRIQPAYAPTGGGVEVIGYFYTSAPQVGSLLAFDSMFTLDPATGGAPSGYFTFITSGTFVQVDLDGSYQGHCWVAISGADPGDVFQIELDRGAAKNGGDSFGVADSGGNLNLSTSTAIDFGFGGSDIFDVAVTQVAGTGTTPTLADHQLMIVKFG